MTGSFKNANGDRVVVAFNAYHIPSTGWAYGISFAIKDNISLTNKGDEFKTFATVLKIIDVFLEEKTFWSATKRPVLLFWTANSAKRSSLYAKLAQRILVKYPMFQKVQPMLLKPEIYSWLSIADPGADNYEGQITVFAKAFLLRDT